MLSRNMFKVTLIIFGLILLLGSVTTAHMVNGARTEELVTSSALWSHHQERQQTVLQNTAVEGTMEWQQTYGGSDDEEAYAVFQTIDGGFVLIGSTQSSGAGYGDAWLVKTDTRGLIQWNQTYGGKNPDEVYAAIQTADGGFALAGCTYSYGVGAGDAWLVKFDVHGEMQWLQTYGSWSYDTAFAVIETTDGGFALAGQTTKEDSYDAWLVKTDFNGELEWQKIYINPMVDEASAVIETMDGGFALAGRTQPNPDEPNDFDTLLMKTDTSGVLQWNRTYGGPGDETEWDWASVVIEIADGGFVLAGSKGGNAWLGKTYANGLLKWNRTYGNGQFTSIIQTVDGGFVLAGRGMGEGGDFLLIKTDVLGEIEWQQNYGGSDFDMAESVIQTADGGFALAGYTRSYGAGGKDFWLVKTKSAATVPATFTLTSPQNTTYTTSLIPVYATNTTEPVFSAWWRYWNSTWSTNQTLIWDEAENRWEAEGLTWLDGIYQVQVYFNNSIGNVAIESVWFTVDTSSPKFTPTVTVVSPNGGEYWNGTQTINWTATDPNADPLIYTVYYSSDGGQIWTQLAARLTETSYQWDTTTVENGANCLIQVEASNGIHTGADVSDAPFEIANGPINIAPVVYVIQPNGGERINGTYEIQWSANDPNGDVLTFNISYSPNRGDTWTQLATGVTEPSYPWNTTTVVNGTSYLIQVEASDGTYTELDVSDNPFEIANEPIPFATQPIKTQSSIDVAIAAAAISGVVLIGAAAKAASIPPPLPGMRFRKDFINRLIWYLLYPFIWLFGHVIYPPVCRRLNKTDVAMNTTRQAILQLLEERGVAYLREIERTIDSGFFGLMWHLQVLEDFGYIRQIRIGKYRVYYLKGYGSSVPPSVELSFLFKNKNTRAIINYINDNPGTYQAEIARAVDLHHTTVRYYLLQMKEQKLFESFSDGRKTRYFLLDEKRPQIDMLLQQVQPEGA